MSSSRIQLVSLVCLLGETWASCTVHQNQGCTPSSDKNADQGSRPGPSIPLPEWGDFYANQKAEWYASPKVRDVCNNVLLYQSPQGGWPKNIDLSQPPTAATWAQIEKQHLANTIDNGATTLPMQFLAFMVAATGDERYRQAFQRGLDYLFAAQYPNGGFPQFFPALPKGYDRHITYNDQAMIRVLRLMRDIASQVPPFTFIDDQVRRKAYSSVEKGIECILRTQVREKGQLQVWCAQHDEITLAPAWARKYEPPSLSGSESVGIVQFLMEMPHPSAEVITAVESAIAWFRASAIKGIRKERFINSDGQPDIRVVSDPTALPLWARFYELDTHRPIFLGRDSTFHYQFGEIEYERRMGYNYLGYWPLRLLEKDYPHWKKRVHGHSP